VTESAGPRPKEQFSDRRSRRRSTPEAVMSASLLLGEQTGSPGESALWALMGSGGCGLRLGAEVSDEVDQLVGVIAVSASELHELSCLGEHGAALGGAGDVDAATAAELEQPLVA
jgi:hypothetical protein